MSKLKETLEINRKGFSLMQELEPRLFWTSIIQGVFEAIYPYIPFFFTSRILTLLINGTIDEELWYLVLGALLSSFVTMIIYQGLSHTRVSLFWRAMDKKEMLLNKKVIHMDYEFIEDSTIHEQLNSVRMNELTGGHGMHRLFNSSKDLIKHLTSIIVASIFLGTLFSSVSQQAIVQLSIDSPWIVAGFIVFLLVYLLLVIAMNQAAAGKVGEYIQNGVKINNMAGYFFPMLMNYNSGKEIRLYQQYPYIDNILDNFESITKDTTLGIVRVSRKANIVSTTVSYVILATGYLWIIAKAFNGAIPPGAVVQYAGALSLFMREFPELLWLVAEFIRNTKVLTDFFDFLELKTDRHEGTLPVEKRQDHEYTLEARNVSFKYPGSDEYVLQNINLKIAVGEKLAIVGMNGSGKTTFIKLLCRLYDPTEGQILLNGIDIQKFNYQEYLRLLSVVFQDFQLYSFQLGENVAASKTVNEEAAVEALGEAGFSDRYQTLEDKLDTYLYKNYDEAGIEISGGEAQKIAMARAIYKNAPIVILDEPTAALDPLSEFDMYTNFAEVVGNRTAIYISHRLSSVRFCDRIAVFDQGSIIQTGGHQELVQDKTGKYYELWQAQAQYYTKDGEGNVQEVALA